MKRKTANGIICLPHRATPDTLFLFNVWGSVRSRKGIPMSLSNRVARFGCALVCLAAATAAAAELTWKDVIVSYDPAVWAAGPPTDSGGLSLPCIAPDCVGPEAAKACAGAVDAVHDPTVARPARHGAMLEVAGFVLEPGGYPGIDGGGRSEGNTCRVLRVQQDCERERRRLLPTLDAHVAQHRETAAGPPGV